MNKYLPHLLVIPEDDEDRQIAEGFANHFKVNQNRIKIENVAGGWCNVLKRFQDEILPYLRKYTQGHALLLIDFDGDFNNRIILCQQDIPGDLKSRVFVVGAQFEPKDLKIDLKLHCEAIGEALANDCDTGTLTHWNHAQLQHNDAERLRLLLSVKEFLF